MEIRRKDGTIIACSVEEYKQIYHSDRLSYPKIRKYKKKETKPRRKPRRKDGRHCKRWTNREKREAWDLKTRGLTLAAISRKMDRSKTAIYTMLQKFRGGANENEKQD